MIIVMFLMQSIEVYDWIFSQHDHNIIYHFYFVWSERSLVQHRIVASLIVVERGRINTQTCFREDETLI